MSDPVQDATQAESSTVHISHPFRIPIFQWQIDEADDLNAQLRDAILQQYESTDGIQVSNRDGGWHSKKNLQDWSAPGVEQFMRHIGSGVRDIVRQTVDEPERAHLDNWLIEAWANVNVKGARNESHAHGGRKRPTLWSGIYYLDSGMADGGGDIQGGTVFEDRIGVPRAMDDTDYAVPQEEVIEPESGLMVMFPSTLHHRVEPYLGDTRRITIAWNLYHPRFRVPCYDETSSSQTVRGSRALWHAVELAKVAKGIARRPSVVVSKLLGGSGRGESEQPSRSNHKGSLGLKDRSVSPLHVPQS